MSPEDYEDYGFMSEDIDGIEPASLNFTDDGYALWALALLGLFAGTIKPEEPKELEHKKDDIYNELKDIARDYRPWEWDSYEERKVACDIVNDFVIDTALVPDRAPFNYETAIKHPEFHYGEWLIISYAVSEEEAKEMHKRQVEYFKEHPDVTMIYEVCDRIWYSRDIDMGEHK